MAKVYLGLGTNLGDKEQNLRDAVQKIEEQVGEVVSLSAFYVTALGALLQKIVFLKCGRLCRDGIVPIGGIARDAND